MIFSNNIQLIILVWLVNILSAGHCKISKTFALNCTMIFQQDTNGIQSTNSRKFSSVTSCPEGYENEDIIAKCEDLIGSESLSDDDLYRPVINDIANVIYWNEFCANCNNDIETEISTTMWSSFTPGDFSCGDLEMSIQNSDVDDLYELSQIFNSKGMTLGSEVSNDTSVECSMEGKWPIHLLRTFIPCLVDDFLIDQEMRLSQSKCQYADVSGRICIKMQLFIEGLYYTWHDGKNERFEYIEKLSDYNFTNGKYYVETGYRNVYYICEQPVIIYGSQHMVKISIVITSLFFVVFYLGLNSNQRKLQDISNKMLYSYMVGLVPISVMLLYIYLSHPVPCVAFRLARFLWGYHFLWTMLIFMEFCFLAYCTSRSCNANHSSILGIKFLFHCIFGFLVPVAVLIIYYFGVLVVNKNHKEGIVRMNYTSPLMQHSCPQIPYHLGVSCAPFQNLEDEYCAYLVDKVQSFVSSFKPVLFLLISGLVPIHITRNYCNRRKSKRIPHRDHLIVLIKMGLIMGFHWILNKVYSTYRNEYSFEIFGLSLETICQSSMDFHGVIVFIFLVAGKCKMDSQREDIEDIELIESRIELIQRRFRHGSIRQIMM